MDNQQTDVRHVDAETYLEHYAEQRYEWKDGVLIPMSPVSLDHDLIVEYLRMLLRAYLSALKLGMVTGGPYVMRLANSFREPDLMVVLKTNPTPITHDSLMGPADICIEVASPSNSNVDYGDKMLEYEAAGVREYWIIDPVRRISTFYRLDDATGYFETVTLTPTGDYRTDLLPKFVLNVPTLWQPELPDFWAIGDMVKKMLAD